MKALSIRQPWTWACVEGFKPVENRTWRTDYRGQLALHASKTFDDEGLSSILALFPNLRARLPASWQLGGIVGVVDVVDCVTQHPSRWFTGPFGLVLANPRPVPFVPFRGVLGFFEVPDELLLGSGRQQASQAEAEAVGGQERLIP